MLPIGLFKNKLALLCLTLGLTLCACDSQVDKTRNEIWGLALTKLKSPSTAKVAENEEYTFNHYEAVTYVIKFDAQNAFGAMVRNQVLAFSYLDKNSGKWVTDSDIDITEAGDSERELFNTIKIQIHENDLVKKEK